MAQNLADKQIAANEKNLGFEILKARNEGFVSRLAKRLMNSPHYNTDDIEDLIQDTWVIAYRNFKEFRGTCQFTTWLYRVEMNRYLNIEKQNGRRPLCLSLDEIKSYREDANSYLDLLESRDHSPSQALEVKTSNANLMLAINRIPPIYRQAVLLRDIEGLSYIEIAAACGVSLEAIKTRIKRGREMIAKKLGSDETMYALRPLESRKIIPALQDRPVRNGTHGVPGPGNG